MKNIFSKLNVRDFILIVVSVALIAFVFYTKRTGESTRQLRKSNVELMKIADELSKKVSESEKEIANRDAKIRMLTTEFDSLIRTADNLSRLYNQKRKQHEKNISTYRRLPVDQRVGEFAKRLSGNH